MKNDYLLDTNILIDASRKFPKAVAFMDELTNYNVSILTLFELTKHATDKTKLLKIQNGFKRLNTVFLDKKAQDLALSLYSEYKLSTGIGIIDSLIAGTAIFNDFTLVTKNTKHFAKIKKLSLFEPY